MNVLVYYTKLKGLWDELDTYRAISICDQFKNHVEKREDAQMMQILMGLNDTFSFGHSNILMLSPLPNICQAYFLVVQDATQQKNDL